MGDHETEAAEAAGQESGDGRAAADPDFLQQFLSYFWMDNTDDEACGQWRDFVGMNPHQADRYLQQLDAVISDPPPELGAHVLDWAWRSRFDETTGEWVAFTEAEAVAWLRGVAADFAGIRAAGQDGQSPA